MWQQNGLPGLKTKIKIFWRALTDVFFDFTEHSTVHGVSYIGDRSRSWFERIFWITGFCISILCCAVLIFDAWNINPIIISFADKPTPIWQVPFPAVTICPTMLVQSKHINITDMISRLNNKEIGFENLTKNEKRKILALSMFCSKIPTYGFNENDTCNRCLDTFRKIRIPPEDMFVECRFQNQLINCTTAFKEIVLEFDQCYTFNGLEYLRRDVEDQDELQPHTWNLDDGYQATAPLDTYPRRALATRKELGLSILLRINKRDLDFSCTSEAGFWIEFRAPGEIPQFKTNFFSTILGNSMTFVMKPNFLKTSKGLRRFAITTRGCAFKDEYPLMAFTQYAQHHCELSCEYYWILENCGCFQISLIKNRRGKNICGPYQFGCVSYFKHYLVQRDYSPCGCLPACSSISFESEVAVTDFNMSVLSDDHKEYGYSKFTFYFKENQFMATQRTELYGTTDFLANCGGILGLCLGVSVISILEIVYFCTIRLCCNLRKNQSQVHSIAIFLEELFYIRAKSSTFMKATKDLVVDYSNRTTIHGFKYVADIKLSLIERFGWASIVVVSVFFCGTLMSSLFKRYDQFPLIISFGSEELSITKIPFPAVTVCPRMVSRDIYHMYESFRVQNESLYDLNEHDMHIVTAVAQVCDPELFIDIDPDNKTNCDHCSANLEYMMGRVPDVFAHCQLFLTDTCENMFTKVATEGGVCFTFNGLEVFRDNSKINNSKMDDWTLDSGYTSNSQTHADLKPRTGTSLMLILDLTALDDMKDGLCKGPIKGFNVYLHLPNETPQISKHYYSVPYDQTVQISVSPKLVHTERDLQHFPIQKRQCYFNDERYLRFFRYYTQNNCEVECLANLTIEECGCQRFYMPNIPGIKVCGISDIKCYQSVIQRYVELNINRNVSSDCHCLPSCTTISFDAEINQFYFKAYDVPADFLSRKFAKVTVVFRESTFVPLKRSQLFGHTEILANYGALLGLFLGFSLMSILELFYFCVVRLFCALKNQMKR